mgnify:CR=1 FL=1
MGTYIISGNLSRAQLHEIARERYGDMVKAVVDLKKGIMSLGPEMHADAETELIEKGSMREDLWGINLYPAETGDSFLEFDSMINIRPLQGNRTRGVEDENIRNQIKALIARMIID